jgi:hypothetical protein
MALEAAAHINQLVATNPTSSDPKNQGDDHLRLEKTVLLTDFPNIGGAVTATHTQLNFVTGVTSAIQTQLDAKVATSATIGADKGGTGVANNVAATLTRSGSHALTLTTTGVTSITLPTSGTVVTSANGRILLATLTASNSASLSDTTSLTSTYKSYEFRFINVVPATNSAFLNFQVSTDGGSNWKTDATYFYVDYGVYSSTDAINTTVFESGTEGAMTAELSSTSTDGGLNGLMRVSNPAGTGCKIFRFETVAYTTVGTALWSFTGAVQYRGSTAAINAIKFAMTSGNITSGSIQVWGYA